MKTFIEWFLQTVIFLIFIKVLQFAKSVSKWIYYYKK